MSSQKRPNSGILNLLVKRTRRKLANGNYSVYDRQDDGSLKFIHIEDAEGKVVSTVRPTNKNYRGDGKNSSLRRSIQDMNKNPDGYEVPSDKDKIAAGWRYQKTDGKTWRLQPPQQPAS